MYAPRCHCEEAGEDGRRGNPFPSHHNGKKMYAMKKYLSLLLILALLLPCSARADEAADAELIWRTADFADVLHQMAISKYYRESCGATGAEAARCCEEIAAVDFGAPRQAWVCSIQSAIAISTEMNSQYGFTDMQILPAWVLACFTAQHAWYLLTDYSEGPTLASNALEIEYSYAPIEGVDRSYLVLLQYDAPVTLIATYIYSPEDGSFRVLCNPVWLADKHAKRLEKSGLADMLRAAGIETSAGATVYEGDALAAIVARAREN